MFLYGYSSTTPTVFFLYQGLELLSFGSSEQRLKRRVIR